MKSITTYAGTRRGHQSWLLSRRPASEGWGAAAAPAAFPQIQGPRGFQRRGAVPQPGSAQAAPALAEQLVAVAAAAARGGALAAGRRTAQRRAAGSQLRSRGAPEARGPGIYSWDGEGLPLE